LPSFSESCLTIVDKLLLIVFIIFLYYHGLAAQTDFIICLCVGVEVHTRSTQNGSTNIFRADAVIVSAPLGVLKANVISFHPSLPEWKTQAIHNLGFGLLNKVCL